MSSADVAPTRGLRDINDGADDAPQFVDSHRWLLELDLLGDIWSVIYLNPEISDGALQLCMAEEKLHGAEVSGFAVNLGGFVRFIECVP
jgi:hypothetical protein